GGDGAWHPGRDHRGPLWRLGGGDEGPRSRLTPLTPDPPPLRGEGAYACCHETPSAERGCLCLLPRNAPCGERVLYVLVGFPEAACFFPVAARGHLAPAARVVLGAVVEGPAARI